MLFARRRIARSLAKQGIAMNLKSYVCIEVFERELPVLYVARPDGEWCFLCGGGHSNEASAYRLVGIDHPITGDPTLLEVLDLDVDEEAERPAVGAAWNRSTSVDPD